MRTVHETEALRPSDPVPKSMQAPGTGGPAGKSSKLKIILKTSQSQANAHDDSVDDSSTGDQDASDVTRIGREHGFTDEELRKPIEKLHDLLRMRLRWAEQESNELTEACKRWEELYKAEWLEKEVLLDQVVHQERNWFELRQAVATGAVDVQVPFVAGAPGSSSAGHDKGKQPATQSEPQSPKEIPSASIEA